jgi:glucosylglycerate synthase
VEVDSIPQQTPEKVAQIGSADIVVGVLAEFNQNEINLLCEGLRTLPGSPRIVVLHRDPAGNAATANSQTTQEDATVSLLPWSVVGPDPLGTPMQSISIAFQSLFALTVKLEARACGFVVSKMESATRRWVCKLLDPLLESDFDLVIPYYAPHKLQGLLNSGIVYPLTRSLYGKRIHNPLGPDVGVSRRLAQKILGINLNTAAGSNQAHPLALLAPQAACSNLQICQVHVGPRVYPPIDWMNLSSLIAQVLGPVFLEVERSAVCWQRTRGSVPVPVRGEATPVSEETGTTLDLSRMVETFQLGVRDLQEIWGLVLPPATLFELRKLSRLAPERVHMPDELWARIVYDFALAHRIRTINRDHLLRSLTPLYLAWVVSYAREVETAGAATVEQRIERLALAYEATKPYFISRWRWPDRFNP